MKQSIPQKGLSYDMIPEGHEELVLVGYNKRGNETAFLKNGLYYVTELSQVKIHKRDLT